MHPDETIARLAGTQFGYVSRPQAVKAGLSPEQIRYRLTTGRWVEAHRSVYRINGAPSSAEGAAYAAHLAAGPCTVVAYATAGHLWAVTGCEDAVLRHLITADDRRVRLPGIVLHRSTTLSRQDVTRLGVIPITTPARTLIDLAGILDPASLEGALDELIRHRSVSPSRLLRRIDDMRGRGVNDLRRLLRDRETHRPTESALESRFLKILRSHGAPEPVRQHVVVDRGVFVARLDFAYPMERIAIEVDGYAFHSSRERFDADRERDHRLRECGWLPLRFTATHIDGDPEGVVRRVLDVLVNRR